MYRAISKNTIWTRASLETVYYERLQSLLALCYFMCDNVIRCLTQSQATRTFWKIPIVFQLLRLTMLQLNENSKMSCIWPWMMISCPCITTLYTVGNAGFLHNQKRLWPRAAQLSEMVHNHPHTMLFPCILKGSRMLPCVALPPQEPLNRISSLIFATTSQVL